MKCAILAVCCLAAVGVKAQPFPNDLLDTIPVIGADEDHAGASVSVTGDSVVLVAWVGGDDNVKAVRLTRDRVLLDTVCLLLHSPHHDVSWGRVDAATSGFNFLVVWLGTSSLQAALVSSSGGIERLCVDTAMSYYDPPRVAYNGRDYVVVYTDLAHRTKFVRVNTSGQVLGPPALVCPGLPVFQSEPDVGAGDSLCLVTFPWFPEDPVLPTILYGNVIRPDGSVQDSTGFVVREWEQEGSGKTTVTGFNGENFVVSCLERPDQEVKITFSRVRPDGVVLDTIGVPVAPASWATTTDVACAGDTTLVVWENDASRVVARRLDGNARLLDSVDIVVSFPVSGGVPSVTELDGEFLIAWAQWFGRDSGGGNNDIVARRVTTGGGLPDPTGQLLSYAASCQWGADVASCGSGFFAAWTDFRGVSNPRVLECGLYGMRFSSDGQRLDPEPIAIQRTGTHGMRLSAGGGVYLVCWGVERRGIYAARVSLDGRLLDSLPIQVVDTTTQMLLRSIVYGDSTFLVLMDNGWRIHGSRITPGGVLLDPAPVRLTAKGDTLRRWPSGAFDGENFLVAWMHTYRNGTRREIRALRVDPNLVNLDTCNIVVSDRNLRYVAGPRVIYGDGVYQVMVSGGDSDVWRVMPSGEVLDTTRIDYTLWGSDVEFDGIHFTLTGFEVDRQRDYHQIKGQRIASDRSLIDTNRVNLTEVDAYVSPIERHNAMAVDSSGMMAVVFETYEPRPFVTHRIRFSVFPRLGAGGEEAVRKRTRPTGPTIIRGMLQQPGEREARLLDVSGRRVIDLQPGENDIRFVTPGVYFVRGLPGSRLRRVVLMH